MTTADQPFEAKEGYLLIGVPGVPYSSVRVPISGQLDVDNTWIEHAMLVATLTSKLYAEAFPAPTARETAQQFTSGQITAEEAGARLQRRPQQTQGTRRANELDQNLVIRGSCPTHGIPAMPSKLEYQEIEIDAETGNERYSKYYCNTPEGRHSLWARQLV
jgi:hypothetical protein